MNRPEDPQPSYFWEALVVAAIVGFTYIAGGAALQALALSG